MDTTVTLPDGRKAVVSIRKDVVHVHLIAREIPPDIVILGERIFEIKRNPREWILTFHERAVKALREFGINLKDAAPND